MFTFANSVPASLHDWLIPVLAPWIQRVDHRLFGLEASGYGLVTFARTPWPVTGSTVVGPNAEVDALALAELAEGSIGFAAGGGTATATGASTAEAAGFAGGTGG